MAVALVGVICAPLGTLSSFRNIFVFYINVVIDKVLLLDKIRAQGIIPLELVPFVILEGMFSSLLLILLNNLRMRLTLF